MKNQILRISLLSALLATAGQAAPFMAVGEGAELFVTGTLGIRADDNIFLAEDGESDVIFDVAPGLDLTFGKGARVQGALTLVHTFSSYVDNSDLNTNLFKGDLVSHYDDGKLKLNFIAGYHELNQNAPDIRGLTRRDVFTAAGNSEFEMSQKTSFGAGVAYRNEDYKRAGYTDSNSLTVPLDVFYEWTPKVDLSVGYRFRDYRANLALDSTDHFFNVGARGAFTPKLSGRFAVGVNNRNFPNGNDDTQLGLDSNFTYELTPKTSLLFGASNDFGTSAQGQQQKNFTLNGAVTADLSATWSVNGGLAYREIDYGTRNDDFVEGHVGTTYIVNASMRIQATYFHRDNSSDVTGGDFNNNVFSVSASFRY